MFDIRRSEEAEGERRMMGSMRLWWEDCGPERGLVGAGAGREVRVDEAADGFEGTVPGRA